MNDNPLANYQDDELESSDFDLDELEASIDADLEASLADLELKKEDREKIGNPESLSETVMNVVWEQFINQVGADAGEEFIKENRGLKLDLRDSAHIQTTENFEKGKTADHNASIDYKQRYTDWQDNFVREADGSIKTRYDRRAGRNLEVLKDGARDYIDDGRETGSAAVHKDHTISAAEIIRDSEAAAHLSREEHYAFANGEKNLLDLDSRANESKRDLKMSEWLESERFGQKPAERFDINEDELRERDRVAREEYDRVKDEGEKRSIETGKASQRQEAVKMGGKALRSFVSGLLVALLKEIFQKFAQWLMSKKRSLSTFIDKVKEAVSRFISNLKEHLKMAAQSTVGALATMIFGPIVRTLQKAWIFLKQGYKSLKEAIAYIKNPANKNKPFSIMMMEVGKIIIAGLTAAGSIVLGGAIEVALSSIPFFAFEIPYLGSLASILGLFLGGLISGLIGALALRLIDKKIAKKQRKIQTGNIVVQSSKVIQLQHKKIAVSGAQLQKKKAETAKGIAGRHQQAAAMMAAQIQSIDNDLDSIYENTNSINEEQIRDITPSANQQAIADLSDEIDAL